MDREDRLLDRSKVSIKIGGYGTASYTSLSDQGLIAITREFKRSLSARMYPLDQDALKRKVADGDYHVSRKIDGEFTLLIRKDSECFTLNPGGTVRIGLPWMEEAVRAFDAAGIDDAILAGELYLKKTAGERTRIHDVLSVVRNPKSEQDLLQVGFAVFDIVSLDQKSLAAEPFSAIWNRIKQIVQGDRFHPVESCLLSSAREIASQFDQWVNQERAEGLIVRGDDGSIFKLKPRHTVDAVVLGFTESTGDREGMLHDLLVGLQRTDGAFQVLTRVGGGLTDEQRRELLSDLRDEVVESEYAEVNSDHVAYQMVRPEQVIELSFLDLVSETTRGGPVNRMVLDFDGQYRVIRRFPLASVISPQFIRLRDDKSVNPQDVGIEQVSKLVNVEQFDQNVRQLVFPKSEVISRIVYTKSVKQSTMVRKFVIIKTNKETQSEDFPAYVLHYTDFSPNRKSPLAREVRVSSSIGQITAIRDGFIRDNIKKGWELVGESVEGASRAMESAVAGGDQTALPDSATPDQNVGTTGKSRKQKATVKKVARKTVGTNTEPSKAATKKKKKKKRAPKKKAE